MAPGLVLPGTVFVGAPGAPGLEVRRHDEHHVLAVCRNVAVVLWVKETQLSAVGGMGELLGELTRGDRRSALLQIAEPSALVPTTEAREAIMAVLKLHTSSLLASAVVFEGDGFRAAAARAVVSGIALMARLDFPHQIFASVPSALEWIESRQSEPKRHLGDGLERAIGQLRSAVQQQQADKARRSDHASPLR